MRTKNSFINFLANTGSYIINLILSFIARTIFIYVLSAEYLGVNGLFGNILSVLSLAELGIGTAMLFHMYKPVAEENEEEICKMMNLYRILYSVVAAVVALLGLALVPFLDVLIKDKPDIEGLTVIYLLYLANTVCSYLWGYKRAIIDAHQKSYVGTLYTTAFQTIQFVLQIIVLLVFRNFIIYLVVQIACGILTNITVAHKADKMYPYLRKDRKSLPEKKQVKSIFKNMGAMSIHKLGDVVLNNTDSLIMSSFVGIISVGIYSNYLMISASINSALMGVLNATIASVGNLSATEDKEDVYRVFKVLEFLCFWMYSYVCVGMMIVYNPFMEAWAGDEYVFSLAIVFLFVFNFYISGMRKVVLIFRDVMGLYWYDRYKPIFEVVINLVVSIILAQYIGIAGVFLGTFVSVMSTCFWVEPLVVYKHGFKKKVSHYFGIFFKYTFIMFAVGGASYWVCSFIDMGGFLEVILKSVICTVLYNGVLLLLFYRTNEFKILWGVAVDLYNGWKNKRKAKSIDDSGE